MTDWLANVFGLLLFGGAVVLGGLILGGRRSRIANVSHRLAAAIAVGATAGSLYFSEVAGFAPCELCWFQRIFMYPLAVVLPLALLRGDRIGWPYATMLAVIGLGIALYHVQLQAFPEQSSFCALANPCTSSPVKALGFLTIPQMSALSFAGITLLTFLGRNPQPDGALQQ